jgi:hypothetical protein
MSDDAYNLRGAMLNLDADVFADWVFAGKVLRGVPNPCDGARHNIPSVPRSVFRWLRDVVDHEIGHGLVHSFELEPKLFLHCGED